MTRSTTVHRRHSADVVSDGWRSKMKCFYREKDNAGSTNVYHVVPHAAGNQSKYLGVLGELVLPIGLRCDPCNTYFAKKMDGVMANHPYVQQHRAIYGVNSRDSSPVYEQGSTRIEATRSGVVGVSGLEIDEHGNFTVPKPLLSGVNHWIVSRMVHKIALESELLYIFENTKSLDAAHEAARQTPLASIVRYAKKAQLPDYRPYGVEGRGASGARRPSRFEFHGGDPGRGSVGDPTFLGYVVLVPNARFTRTLTEDSALLRNMLRTIDHFGLTAYLGTSEVFWTRKGNTSGLVPPS
jgi:hypothetical protein